MHRHLTLVLALSLLFTIVLPIHALTGGVESHGHVAHIHNRMLKKRGSNPLAALLGNPNAPVSSGDGGAANVAPDPSAQSQNDPSSSDDTGDSTLNPSGQPGSNSGSTADNGDPTNGGTQSGSAGSASGDANSGVNQPGNQNNPAGSSQQGGSPLGTILTNLLGNPKATPTPSSATPSNSNSANSTSITSTSSSSTTSTSSTSSTSPSSTPTSTSSPTSPISSSLSPTSDVTTTTTTSSTTPSQTAPPTDDDSNQDNSTTITRNTIIILVAIGASIGVAAIVWTVIRKWKFRPSSSFEGRMQPIDWQPTTHDDEDIIANRLNRNVSTRSHGSFTSGNGHSEAADGGGLVSDLPSLDAMGGSSHLGPVGGYANLHRGPSPQPMYELPNPHQFPMSQQHQYNVGSGSTYGY